MNNKLVGVLAILLLAAALVSARWVWVEEQAAEDHNVLCGKGNVCGPYKGQVSITNEMVQTYCKNKYGDSTNGSQGYTRWCGYYKKAIEMDAVCRWQHGSGASAINTNNGDLKSFQCQIPTGNYQHYSIDVTRYCKNLGYGDAWINSRNAAFSWFCHYNKPDYSLTQADMDRACNSQYPGSVARYGNINEAKSWFCSLQYRYSGLDVTGWCKSQKNLDEAVIENNSWFCKGKYNIDTSDLCKTNGKIAKWDDGVPVCADA